jgi:O-antigen chain-terminating methyltransferase
LRRRGGFESALLRAVKLLGEQVETLRGENDMLRRDLASMKALLALREHAAAPAAPAETHGNRSLDAFYLAFENEFRGTRAEVKDRLRIYLPILSAAAVGGPRRPVLDLACGRGEWLELLKENGCSARGVDLNAAAIAICRELELDAAEAEAWAHLRSLPDGSLGAVTAFHLIEHLALPVLLDLLVETWRVLQPGGLLIVETPNPDNVLVGACNFHMDPTHHRPLPNQLAAFLLRHSGFTEIQVLPLHPYGATHRVGDASSPLAQRFNDYFHGPQDYAVIGLTPPPVA